MSAYNIPSEIVEGGQVIQDAEWAPGERYTIAGIIRALLQHRQSQSPNHVSEQTQYDYLRAFGLGQLTGIGLPGESAGLLPPVSQWAADTRYTLSFGQGVATTAIQMAEVYATIANDGVRVQPTWSRAPPTPRARTPRPRRLPRAGSSRPKRRMSCSRPAAGAGDRRRR